MFCFTEHNLAVYFQCKKNNIFIIKVASVFHLYHGISELPLQQRLGYAFLNHYEVRSVNSWEKGFE